jgi:hypothetical protein
MRALLQQAAAPLSPAEVAARCSAVDKERLIRIGELLATLVSLGQAQAADERFVAP